MSLRLANLYVHTNIFFYNKAFKKEKLGFLSLTRLFVHINLSLSATSTPTEHLGSRKLNLHSTEIQQMSHLLQLSQEQHGKIKRYKWKTLYH